MSFYENENFGHKKFIYLGPDFSGIKLPEKSISPMAEILNYDFYSRNYNPSTKKYSEGDVKTALLIQNERNRLINDFRTNFEEVNDDTDITKDYITLRKIITENNIENFECPVYVCSLFCPRNITTNNDKMIGWIKKYVFNLLELFVHLKYYFNDNIGIRMYLDINTFNSLNKIDKKNKIFDEIRKAFNISNFIDYENYINISNGLHHLKVHCMQNKEFIFEKSANLFDVFNMFLNFLNFNVTELFTYEFKEPFVDKGEYIGQIVRFLCLIQEDYYDDKFKITIKKKKNFFFRDAHSHLPCKNDYEMIIKLSKLAKDNKYKFNFFPGDRTYRNNWHSLIECKNTVSSYEPRGFIAGVIQMVNYTDDSNWFNDILDKIKTISLPFLIHKKNDVIVRSIKYFRPKVDRMTYEGINSKDVLSDLDYGVDEFVFNHFLSKPYRTKNINFYNHEIFNFISFEGWSDINGVSQNAWVNDIFRHEFFLLYKYISNMIPSVITYLEFFSLIEKIRNNMNLIPEEDRNNMNLLLSIFPSKYFIWYGLFKINQIDKHFLIKEKIDETINKYEDFRRKIFHKD